MELKEYIKGLFGDDWRAICDMAEQGEIESALNDVDWFDKTFMVLFSQKHDQIMDYLVEMSYGCKSVFENVSGWNNMQGVDEFYIYAALASASCEDGIAWNILVGVIEYMTQDNYELDEQHND